VKYRTGTDEAEPANTYTNAGPATEDGSSGGITVEMVIAAAKEKAEEAARAKEAAAKKKSKKTSTGMGSNVIN